MRCLSHTSLASSVPPKRISFSTQDKSILLIESHTEYDSSLVWYTQSHFAQFRNDAVQELRGVMKDRGITCSNKALEVLYQPSEEDLCQDTD